MLHRLWRIPTLIGLLFAGLATVFLVFPCVRARHRECLIAQWSRALLRACGTRVVERRAEGVPALMQTDTQGCLLLANHVSWLDIFAIDSLAPASFVAKSEIAAWPLAGTLVARAGTLFVERGRRHAVHAAVRLLAERLRSGARGAVFPEGTTSDGRRLLPFHGNLVQAALDVPCPMVPLGIRYLDVHGRPSEVAPFVGEQTFLQSLWRITGTSALVVELHVLPAIPYTPGLRRQHAAQRARGAIAQALGLPMDDRLPEIFSAQRAQSPAAARPDGRPDARQ